jgi:hypothetical protein
MHAPQLKTCFHHPGREAVVRCPECGRFFCRECVTEHDHRMLCSGCLHTLNGRRPSARRRSGYFLALSLQGLLGFILLWGAFYLVGRMLLVVPDSFHEGTIWESSFREPS